MKVAVLGYGHLGKWHCEKAFKLLGENFKYIVESFPKNQLEAKTKYPHVQVVQDIKDIVHDIDAAIIVTPTSTHFEIVKFLLQNHKHVFCEKPLAVNIEELNQLKAHLKNDLVLQVGHIERFQSVWKEWKSYFHHDQKFTMTFKRSGSFKGRATDVHVLTDLMIHDLDLLLWLKKQRPVEIHATGFKLRTEYYDEVNVNMYYQDGSLAQFLMSRNYVKELREIDFTDSRGTLQIDLLSQTILKAPADRNEPPFVDSIKFEKVDQLYLEQEHFYQSIKAKTKPLVSYQEAYEAQYFMDKVLESLETGKKCLL